MCYKERHRVENYRQKSRTQAIEQMQTCFRWVGRNKWLRSWACKVDGRRSEVLTPTYTLAISSIISKPCGRSAASSRLPRSAVPATQSRTHRAHRWLLGVTAQLELGPRVDTESLESDFKPMLSCLFRKAESQSFAGASVLEAGYPMVRQANATRSARYSQACWRRRAWPPGVMAIVAKMIARSLCTCHKSQVPLAPHHNAVILTSQDPRRTGSSRPNGRSSSKWS